MPPSSRTTMRLLAARDGDQIAGVASAAAPVASSRLRREIPVFDGVLTFQVSLCLVVATEGERDGAAAGGSTRPGLNRPSGSKACFTARINASSPGAL